MKWHFFRDNYQGLSARAFHAANESSAVDVNVFTSPPSEPRIPERPALASHAKTSGAAIAICNPSPYTSRRMSDQSVELDLKFLPDWLKEAPSSKNRYSDYEGEPERPRRDDRRGPRPFPGGGGGPRGDQRGPRPGGPRPGGPGGPRPDQRGPGG